MLLLMELKLILADEDYCVNVLPCEVLIKTDTFCELYFSFSLPLFYISFESFAIERRCDLYFACVCFQGFILPGIIVTFRVL